MDRFSLTESGGSVLGANTIRGHDVFFDIPESSRIGFAPSDCDYYNLIGTSDDDVNEDVETNKMEVPSNDDYYEEETQQFNNEEPESPTDGVYDDDSILHPSKNQIIFGHEIESNLFVVVASIAIVGLVGFMLVGVVKKCRNGPKYSNQLTGEHLDDLHLDAEIETLPALA